jgi:hypothetical protein
MKRFSLCVLASLLGCVLWAGSANAQQGDTSICPALFSGSQGAAFKQDNPPRYSMPAQNNGGRDLHPGLRHHLAALHGARADRAR